MRTCQSKWAEHKYWVMAHSQQHYNQIRELFKYNQWTPDKTAQFEQLLQEAAQKKPTVKTLTTAYQHVWGYFKKICTVEEKDAYLNKLASLDPDHDELGPFLKTMTFRYQITYLLESKLIRDLDNSH